MSIFKKIFGSHSEAEQASSSEHTDSKSNNSHFSVEELFTLEFKNNGGKFIYCENLDEIKTHFEDILEENDWFESEVLCFEKKLFPFLDENKLNYTNTTNPKFLFSSCENLIADEGSILFCSNQLKELKPQQLPENIIVFATTSQILMDKNIGMTEIRKRYMSGYPSNITTMKYFEKAKEEDFLHYGSVAKNLYLLLLEDL
jgi:L-lactate utilization protein LutC